MAFSVRRSLAWMTLAQGSSFVVQFGSSLILARLLTPYEMGVYAVALAIVGLLSTLRAIGLPSYVVRAAEVTPDLLASVFTVNAGIALLLAGLIAGLSALGGALLGEEGVRHLLLVMAVLPLIAILDFRPAAMIERAGNFRVIAGVNVARTVLANGVTLSMAYAGFSYMSLAYGSIVSAVVGVIGVNAIGWRYASLRISFAEWRAITRYGLQMLTISGVSVATYRLSEMVMGRLLGLAALGVYSRATALNGLLWENVHLLITRIIFVDFAEQKREGKSLREPYLRIVQMMTGLLWPAFGGMAVVAGPLVVTLYGPIWAEAAVPLSLLSLAAMVLVSITMTWEVFVVCGETGRQARFEFLRAASGLGMFALGCLAGLAGAAIGRIGEAAFASALYRPHLERMTDTTLADFLPIYLRSALLTAVAVAPAGAVMALHGWSPQTPLLALGPAVGLGVALWAGTLWALGHPLAAEAGLLLGRLRRRAA